MRKQNLTQHATPRGGALDVRWPQIPVAHLSHETDGYFCVIDCLFA